MMNPIENLIAELEGRNYSDKTIKNYVAYCNKYLKRINKKGLEINPESLKDYSYSIKKKYSTSTAKLNICALRHFVINVLNRPELTSVLPSIRQESKLPVVLSKEEVKKLIDSTLNSIHKTILTFLYCCGVRIGELLLIKMGDIDFDRKLVLVHGKGKKDRFVPINDTLANLIKTNMGHLKYNENFCTTTRHDRFHKPRKICSRTVAKIINQCAERAGINKRTYPHLLRHSLATHLIEDGIDIRYIQILLGHTSILATSHYTHIARMPNNLIDCKINYLFE